MFLSGQQWLCLLCLAIGYWEKLDFARENALYCLFGFTLSSPSGKRFPYFIKPIILIDVTRKIWLLRHRILPVIGVGGDSLSWTLFKALVEFRVYQNNKKLNRSARDRKKHNMWAKPQVLRNIKQKLDFMVAVVHDSEGECILCPFILKTGWEERSIQSQG